MLNKKHTLNPEIILLSQLHAQKALFRVEELRMMMMVSDYGDDEDYCSPYIGSSQNENSASKWSNRNWNPSPQFEEYLQVKLKALLHKKKRILNCLALLTLFGLVWQWYHLKADLCTIDAKKGEKNASKHSSFNTFDYDEFSAIIELFPKDLTLVLCLNTYLSSVWCYHFGNLSHISI